MASRLPLVPLPLSRARSAEDNARNVRQRVEMPSTPPPALLAAMPSQVIEVLVSQAALAARDEANPPEAICKWMKTFCKAMGARSCPDDLFRRALDAWGFVPKERTRETIGPDPENPGKYINLRGQTVRPPEEVEPPAWAGFDSWRAFFAALCEAWYGRASLVLENYRPLHSGSMWIDAANRLNGVSAGSDRVAVDAAKARFVNPNMSQREKDTLLDSLMTHVDSWVEVAVDREHNRANEFEDLTLSAPDLEDHRLEKWRRIWFVWRYDLNRNEPNPFRSERAPWRAVAALLAMRGGRVVISGDTPWPRPMKKYEEADKMLYSTVVMVQRGDLALTEEVLEQVRVLLKQEEANPNPNYDFATKGLPRAVPREGFETLITTMPHPPPLILAIWTRNGPLVKLLLEFGATSAYAGGRSSSNRCSPTWTERNGRWTGRPR